MQSNFLHLNVCRLKVPRISYDILNLWFSNHFTSANE